MTSTPLYYGYDNTVPSSYTFKLQFNSGNAHDEILNLFCVAPLGDTPGAHTPPKLLSLAGEVTAVSYKERVYIFDRQSPSTESFTFQTADVRGKEIILLDLDPNKPYTITAWPAGTFSTVPALADGTLVVPVSASTAGDSLTITAGGTLPPPPPTPTTPGVVGNTPGSIRLVSSNVKRGASRMTLTLNLSVTGFKRNRATLEVQNRQGYFAQGVVRVPKFFDPGKTKTVKVKIALKSPVPQSGASINIMARLRTTVPTLFTTQKFKIAS